MSVFEVIMLVCFGCSWPINIYKSLTSRSTGGKSPYFMMMIMAGYIMGILHKIFYNPDFVIVLYALNLLMVGFDLLLFYRNRKLEQRKELPA